MQDRDIDPAAVERLLAQADDNAKSDDIFVEDAIEAACASLAALALPEQLTAVHDGNE